MASAERGRGRLKKLAIAFYAWAKGYLEEHNKAQLLAMGDSEKETVETVLERVQRNKLPGYADDNFWEAVQMWRDWKCYGNPEAGGTMDQGALWLDVMRVMNTCAQKMRVE
jgi:hypothetical protein